MFRKLSIVFCVVTLFGMDSQESSEGNPKEMRLERRLDSYVDKLHACDDQLVAQSCPWVACCINSLMFPVWYGVIKGESPSGYVSGETWGDVAGEWCCPVATSVGMCALCYISKKRFELRAKKLECRAAVLEAKIAAIQKKLVTLKKNN